ncbi:MAG: carboxypeptidase-like regulatory domain-containing protein, partial [Bryobacteraceae bacterium]
MKSTVVVLFFLSVLPVLPQSVTADLVVNVTDPSGAVISGGTLELTQVETNLKFKGSTDGNGNYIFLQMRPGEYELNVTAPGFRPQNVSAIRLVIGQRARVDVNMEVGAVTEAVTVSAGGAVLLNAESAAVGQVIESKTIVELPLNGRNFLQLAQISAGAIPIGTGTSPATSWTGRPDST